jgi:hypothetical protein
LATPWFVTNSCPPVTASVPPAATVPGARFTKRLSPPTTPKETVLVWSATDPKPSAMLESAVACAFSPIAIPPRPWTLLNWPTAIAAFCLADASAPIASAPVASARLLAPSAVADPPIAVAKPPTDVDESVEEPALAPRAVDR